MAVTMTVAADLGSAGTTAYEQLAYFALRPEFYFQNMFDVRPTNQSHRGVTVSWEQYSDIAAATGALTEDTDVTATDMVDTTVSVTIDEYGMAVKTSAEARGTSFLNIDMDAANIVGYNAGITQDTLARNTITEGSNAVYSGTGNTADGDVANGDTIVAADVLEAVANLRANNARPWMDGCYVSVIHPYVSLDLRSETGTAAWADPAAYSDATRQWNGVVGKFGGVIFMESSTAFNDTGGTLSEPIYDTVICGRQAGAFAFSSVVSGPLPRIIVGPVTDNLRRFNTVGWYQLAGWGRFREAALYKIVSATSLT